jgi:radical SAM family uncharacterized protein
MCRRCRRIGLRQKGRYSLVCRGTRAGPVQAHELPICDRTLAERVRRELLPYVRQPAQYIGGEVNQLVRPGDWEGAEVRVAIAFPDTYAVGMSHLGCQILYWIANHTPGVCAERVYCPWTDAEKLMRQRRIPLFTWDTRQPVREADILAISLQYELCFTSVLTLLDLAGIPLRSADRTDRDPLVIAGGPQADNPEPMADFLDLVVIGDGEHSLAAILEACRQYRREGVPRRQMILLLARRFPWIYAPNLYQPRYNPDGTLAELVPRESGLPTSVRRCFTPDFEEAAFPVRPLVPWIETVHDRISIEIMRGCPQLCRFCHAGYTKRPLVFRTIDRILEIAEQSWSATGHEEIGLLSLSTADYPRLAELARRFNERFSPRMVNISLPSLRVDTMLRDIPQMASAVRKGGLTIAIEAARDELRRAIRKKVADTDLLDGVRAAYAAGWRRVKLYFMAGFPGEQEADIEAIYELSRKIAEERRRLGKGPAQVTASVSWLVPKPFTPLQWMAQPDVRYFEQVRQRLRRLAASGPPYVKIQTHRPQRSILEAVFARGDRRLSAVIYEAWRRGARLDAWDETFNPAVWDEAFEAAGVDPGWYAHRERPFDERLPWDHIELHLPRSFLERAYRDVLAKVNRAIA